MRVGAAEVAQVIGEHTFEDGHAGKATPHRADLAGCLLVGEGQRVCGLREGALRLDEQRLSGFGGLNPPVDPDEQRAANLALEALNLGTQGGLGHVEPCSGAAEMVLMGDRHEVPR
jgi:hypothetical protein